jgi:four helix bundle protein
MPGSVDRDEARQMSRFGEQLVERVERAVDRTIRMALALPRNVAGSEIGRQVVRSSGSVGANLEEAQACTSRKDFTHKLSLSLREARETLYWMRRIENARLLKANRLAELTAEWDELVAILTSIQAKLRRRLKGDVETEV